MSVAASFKRRLELEPGYPYSPSKRARLIQPMAIEAQQQLQKTSASYNISLDGETSAHCNANVEQARASHYNVVPHQERQLGTSSARARANEQPLFTYSDLCAIVERKLGEQKERLRQEYDEQLAIRLADQYDNFLKFTQDEICKRLNPNNLPSYMS